jgi:hypothetical protein
VQYLLNKVNNQSAEIQTLKYAAAQSATPEKKPAPPLTKIVIGALENAHNGNLGGITGANNKCQAEADKYNKAGKWVAMLGTDTQSIRSLIKSSDQNLKVYNLKNTLMADNWNTFLTSFSSRKEIYFYAMQGRKVDEGTGASPDWNDADVWFGADNSGNIAKGRNCNGWTSTSASSACVSEIDTKKTICGESHSCSKTFAVLCIRVATEK